MSTLSMAGDSLDLDAILEPHGLARDITNQWEEWDQSKNIAKDRWSETTEYLYATSTRETNNSQNNWSHSTHIPKLTQIYDNLVANYQSALFPHDDWLKFVALSEDSSAKEQREAVEAYIKTKHDQMKFKDVARQLLEDWVHYGNCFALVTYETKSHDHPIMGPISGYTGPKIYRISPYDIVFNALASDFESSPKIIRSLKSMGELHRMMEENQEQSWSKDVLEKMKEFRAMSANYSPTDFEKSSQLQFDGFGSITQYLESGYVEILEFYGDYYDRHEDKFYKNHVITIADRTWVIRNEPINNYIGRPHIYHCGWRNRADNLWAMGPLDNLVGMQYLIDHLENARADAFDQMLVPTRVIVGDVEEEDVVPGKPAGAYYIPNGEGSVDNLAPDTTVLNADLQIQQKENQMEMYAGSPRETMGFRTPGEKTAFEVQQLMNAASRIFQHKIDYFESNFLEKIVNAELEVSRRNLNGSDVAQIMDNNLGVRAFLNITPEDLTAKGLLVPRGARHFARQNQLAQNLAQVMQMFGQDPMLMQHFPSVDLARSIEELLGFENLDIVTPFGRIAEQAQMARQQQTAQQQVELEGANTLAEEETPNGQNQQ